MNSTHTRTKIAAAWSNSYADAPCCSRFFCYLLVAPKDFWCGTIAILRSSVIVASCMGKRIGSLMKIFANLLGAMIAVLASWPCIIQAAHVECVTVRDPDFGFKCSTQTPIGTPCVKKGSGCQGPKYGTCKDNAYSCYCDTTSSNVTPEISSGQATSNVTPLQVGCNQTVSFSIAGGTTTLSYLTDALGGGAIITENATGQFTVVLSPVPGRADVCDVGISVGEFSAPSSMLPNGETTGINSVIFSPLEASSGRLTLKNGSFTAQTTGKLYNDHFPSGLPIVSTVGGAVDFASGTLSFSTNSCDFHCCDLNEDGSIDIDDIKGVMAARNRPAAEGDPRDCDRDGLITVNDARICVLGCTLPTCRKP